jgi:hypothetical protein
MHGSHERRLPVIEPASPTSASSTTKMARLYRVMPGAGLAGEDSKRSSGEARHFWVQLHPCTHITLLQHKARVGFCGFELWVARTRRTNARGCAWGSGSKLVPECAANSCCCCHDQQEESTVVRLQ